MSVRILSKIAGCSLIIGAVLLSCAALALAKSDMTGWEADSEYNKLYNYKERDTIRGHIVKFVKVKPLKGMAPGTAFTLDEGGGDTVLVHVCPEAYATVRETGLKPGEWLKVKGAWAEIGDESIFMAAKIRRQSGSAYKVRLTKDGTPFWTMSPERLAKELAETE